MVTRIMNLARMILRQISSFDAVGSDTHTKWLLLECSCDKASYFCTWCGTFERSSAFRYMRWLRSLIVLQLICRAVLLNVNEPEARGFALGLMTVLDDIGKGAGPFVVSQLIQAFRRYSLHR